MDPSKKSQMLMHYDGKLKNLALNEDTTASEFINIFEQYIQASKTYSETQIDNKQLRWFKQQIVGKNYITEKRSFDASERLKQLVINI